MSTSETPSLVDFLRRSYPSAIFTTTSDADISQFAHNIFPNTSYTDIEKIEMTQWLTTSSRLASLDEDEAKHAERLGSLNIHLSTRTTLLGTKPSIADVALYFRIAPTVKAWTVEERTGEHGYHHVVRFIDFVQNAPLFGISLNVEEKVDVDVNDVKFVQKPVDAKEEKERKKKEKAAAATALIKDTGSQESLPVGKSKDKATHQSDQGLDPATTSVQATPSSHPQSSVPKREKKEKPAKTPKPPPADAPILSPSLIDLRVGHILRAIPHPNADSLYVSTIACGDSSSTPNTSFDEATGKTVRTVCSGLNGLIPLSELQNRKVVAVCNLKPVTMRGVKSAAMVLAASPSSVPGEEADSAHKGPVELVNPPEGAEAGDRVYFEGWEGEPESVLNPKKKVWETLQPAFTTTGEMEVGFRAGAIEGLKERGAGSGGVAKLRTKGGVCSVKSLRGAVVR